MIEFFSRLLGRGDVRRELSSPRPRIFHETDPDLLYAIGDVHGRIDLLTQLEERISAEASQLDTTATVVLLGDLIDRGTGSAQVLDHLLSPAPDNVYRQCLAGNHEFMMLDYVADPKRNKAWLDVGGADTLISYGIPSAELSEMRRSPKRAEMVLQSYIPTEHLSFLASLPTLIAYPSHILAHAGLRPGVQLSEQADTDIVMIREPFLSTGTDFGRPVVHGHTIVDTAEVLHTRINLDTGAYLTGRLTAARLIPGAPPELLTT